MNNEFICMTREERIQFYLGKDLISGNYDSNLKKTVDKTKSHKKKI